MQFRQVVRNLFDAGRKYLRWVRQSRVSTGAAILAAGLGCPLAAQATLGIYEHGAGIKSLGYGGVDYVGGEESTAVSANPAMLGTMGSRFDVGSDVLTVRGRMYVHDNALGPDAAYDSDARHIFPIPQAGATYAPFKSWTFGVTAFAAGFGPDYEHSPYARFAPPPLAVEAASAGSSFKVMGLSLASAYEVIPHEYLGVAFNEVHESLTIKGIAAFGMLSENPSAVSDTGKHGALGSGFTVGWMGRLTPWLDGGLSYQSQTWIGRIGGYSGLLPDQGRLNLPAIYGGALQFTLTRRLQAAVQFQRYDYSRVHGFGNSNNGLLSGSLLGSSDGPGFGWSSQNTYKLGARFQATRQLAVRAGFIYANEMIPPSQTLFSALSPATTRIHFTGGFTYGFLKASEVSGYLALARTSVVHGVDSIPGKPTPFGGGNLDPSFRNIDFGLTYGLRFGATSQQEATP